MASKLKLVKGDPFSFVGRLTKNTTVTESPVNWTTQIELRKGSIRGDAVPCNITMSPVSTNWLITIPDTSILPVGYYVLYIKLTKTLPAVVLRKAIPLTITEEE